MSSSSSSSSPSRTKREGAGHTNQYVGYQRDSPSPSRIVSAPPLSPRAPSASSHGLTMVSAAARSSSVPNVPRARDDDNMTDVSSSSSPQRHSTRSPHRLPLSASSSSSSSPPPLARAPMHLPSSIASLLSAASLQCGYCSSTLDALSDEYCDDDCRRMHASIVILPAISIAAPHKKFGQPYKGWELEFEPSVLVAMLIRTGIADSKTFNDPTKNNGYTPGKYTTHTRDALFDN